MGNFESRSPLKKFSKDHQQKVKAVAERFSNQAKAYNQRAITTSGDLSLLLKYAKPKASDSCLDIATGTGNVALKLAEICQQVTAVDISKAMLAFARQAAHTAKLSNITFIESDCHHLPLQKGTFDLITCRFSTHHFTDIECSIEQMKHLLHPSGRLIIEDSLAPPIREQAKFLNKVEKIRDTTHVRTLSLEDWRSLLDSFNLKIESCESQPRKKAFVPWCERAGLNAKDITDLSRKIQNSPEHLREVFFTCRGEEILSFLDKSIVLKACHIR